MTADHYANSALRWATGAALVYGPIAAQLIARSPHPLAGRLVLDAGAGTGVASAALAAAGAACVSMDLSHPMLTWEAALRPPGVVGDIGRLPLRSAIVDDGVAAFVLNHLTDPSGAFAELSRVIRPGGAILACVYSTASRNRARDHADEVARTLGWEVPDWYRALKEEAVPVLGNAAAMRSWADAAGLVDVRVEEGPVDVGIGVDQPDRLVDYRLGQAHFAAWLEAMDPSRAAAVRAQIIGEIRPVMEPLRPVVVFLAARTPPA